MPTKTSTTASMTIPMRVSIAIVGQDTSKLDVTPFPCGVVGQGVQDKGK
jgi:hypothetical protein